MPEKHPQVMLDAVRTLLRYIGEDPTREGLLETPDRFLSALKFWNQGYNQDSASVLKMFGDGSEGYDEMVLQRHIPVWSTCEHHMAPFFGTAHVAYIPGAKGIVGLSKMSRLLSMYSRRLQVQERLTKQFADAFEKHVEPKGMAVVLQCRHLCMESRGVQNIGTTTTTSALRGVLLTKPEARAEFMSFISSVGA